MISCLQNPARAERAFPPALLIFGCLLVWISQACAHDPGLSALTLRMGGAEISASLVISESETAAVPARGPVRLVCDGRELATALHTLSISTNGQDVVWNFSVPRPRGSEFEIHATALVTLPRGHRQFVKVLDARERTLATALLSTERPSLKCTLSGVPAVPIFPMSWWTWLWPAGVFAGVLAFLQRRPRRLPSA